MSASTTYLKQLEDELTRAGIRGARRNRILTEFRDHLESLPEADAGPQARLGSPAPIARQFADELGTSFARRAAFWAFAALAVAGGLLLVRALAFMPLRTYDGGGYDTIALLICAVTGQVALAAGGLALLRALWRRRERAIPREEATVLIRRALVGLGAAAVTTLALPLHAAASQPSTNGTNWTGLAAMIGGIIVLAAAAPALIRALRLRPQNAGPRGDLITDLGPVGAYAGSPFRFAIVFATAIAVLVALAGVAASDPFDGIFRGVAEGGACFVGFLALGRYLGLTSAGTLPGATEHASPRP